MPKAADLGMVEAEAPKFAANLDIPESATNQELMVWRMFSKEVVHI